MRLAWIKKVSPIQSQRPFTKVAGGLGSERGDMMMGGEGWVLHFEDGERGHTPKNAGGI